MTGLGGVTGLGGLGGVTGLFGVGGVLGELGVLGVLGEFGVCAVRGVLGVFGVLGLGEVFTVTLGLADGEGESVACGEADGELEGVGSLEGPVGSSDGSGVADGAAVAAGTGAAEAALLVASATAPVTQSPSVPVTAQAAVDRVNFMIGPSSRGSVSLLHRPAVRAPGAGHESPLTAVDWIGSGTVTQMRGWRRWLAWGGLALPPMIAALFIAGTQIPGSVLWPWHPGMIDLEVYQRTGGLLLSGGDIYNAGGLPWIYPPFGALLTVPWALLAFEVAAVVWLALNVGALAAVLFRLGLSGWRLSLVTTVCVLFVEPVAETLGFGNLGILLVAAAVLDSMPGPRVLRRRILPEGWLTGLATAVKLTPALVAAHNFFSGRRRPGVVAFLTFLVATAIGFVVMWGGSLHYWGGLLAGDTGLNSGLVYATNQSVMGVWSRLFGEAGRGGLLLSAAVVVLGLVASVMMHRAGEPRLAIALAGLTSLLASPISWSHHYVWIVPLGILLWQCRSLPAWFRGFGFVYVAWGVVAPFKWIPRGDDVELTYSLPQRLLVNGGVVAGVLLLVLAIVASTQVARVHRAQAEPAGALP